MNRRSQPIPRRSLVALNAANFFQAETVGVILPVLSVFLRKANWRYDEIGWATAIAGLGTLLFQAPAGWLTDKLACRRALFAVAAVFTGLTLGLLPVVPRARLWVDSLLFASGAAQSLFAPLFGALALALARHRHLNRVMGSNQSWNHAGNVAAAAGAIALVSTGGLTTIFAAAAFCSILAAGSVLLMRERDLDEHVASGLSSPDASQPSEWGYLFKDRTVILLLISIFLFHLANAPILPMVALYVKHLGGSDNWMTATVLTAQVVMIPVAWLAGRYCDVWGRKPVLAVAYAVLPLRVAAYAFARTPEMVVYLQALDGIGAGIYGVAVAAVSADLTQHRGGFNTLMGLFATALAVGAVIGPALSGMLVQHLGFAKTFLVFATVAAAGTAIFWCFVPETRSAPEPGSVTANASALREAECTTGQS